MAFEFKLPDIGEGVHEGEIVRWLVEPGQPVEEDQALVEVMTDKVTAEIPSPVSGTLIERRGGAGDVVRVGSVIAVLDETGVDMGATGGTGESRDVGASKEDAEQEGRAAGPTTAQAVREGAAPPDRVLAAPATRRLAREMGVDLSVLTGSGPRGRVTPADVRAGVREFQPASLPAVPVAGINGFRTLGERREPFTPLRRKIAERLVKSKQTAPHFAYVEEVDVTRLVALKDELLPDAEAMGLKLTYLPFIIKAVVAGLRKHPILNAQLDEERQEIVYRNDCHIGVAVSIDQGLVVPVIRHAGQKSLSTLAREIAELADKARHGKLSPEEMQGGTFTVSNIGSIGGLFGIPIINYPEVAILGVNKVEKRPVVRTIDGEDRVVIRDMLNLSISGDHRVVDGVETALFIREVAARLENPGRLLLADGL
jgi:pyruvate dehydrogenase E2 component (dihydrolipoamide acetyltransferase)